MGKPICKKCGTTDRVLMERQILSNVCWKCAHIEHDLNESKTRILIRGEFLTIAHEIDYDTNCRSVTCAKMQIGEELPVFVQEWNIKKRCEMLSTIDKFTWLPNELLIEISRNSL